MPIECWRSRSADERTLNVPAIGYGICKRLDAALPGSDRRNARRKSANSDLSLQHRNEQQMHDVVFLFDVDNTLIDNDRIQQDLREHLEESYGRAARERYWAIFDELWVELGYADYIGALERYRAEKLHDPTLLRIANWLLDYPFAERLYAGALDAVTHVRQWGLPVILSDGDAVFQVRKVERSGLWKAFDNRVLIYIHKENELAEVERLYPAKHYVLVDDKLRSSMR